MAHGNGAVCMDAVAPDSDRGGWWLSALTVLLAISIVSLIYFVVRPENLVRNSSFREGVKFWGTGYLESLVSNGNFPADFRKQYPLILHGGADATARRDGLQFPKGGLCLIYDRA